MTINMMLTNPGTRLSCIAEVPQAQRQGAFIPVSVLSDRSDRSDRGSDRSDRGTQRLNRRWATTGETFAHTAAFGGYSKAAVALPVIKQFRVPLSIRERSS